MGGEFSSAGIALRASAFSTVTALGWMLEIHGDSVNECESQRPGSGLSGVILKETSLCRLFCSARFALLTCDHCALTLNMEFKARQITSSIT